MPNNVYKKLIAFLNHTHVVLRSLFPPLSLCPFVCSGPDRNQHLLLLFPQVEADESSKEQKIKMASQEESVREFVAVTDVDEERARFFLESAGWNLQVRLLWTEPYSCGGKRERKRR